MSTDQVTASNHVTEFDELGFTIFRDALDDDLLAEASGHVKWLSDQHPDVRPEQLGHTYLKDDPFWLRLVSDDRLLDIAELFIGPDISLFASHYISKPPFSGRPVLWHQDGSYWPLEPMEVVSLWLAVDDSTLENGCMKVIPRSHRGELHGVHPNTEVESVLGSETDSEVDETAAVPLVLAAGDVEVHHPTIMHASDANRSEHRRCGLTIRYIPSTTRIIADEDPFPSAFHLRGAPGVNRYQERPRFDPAKHFMFRDRESWA
jgi:phytanoyl-CoA hydroxylase